MYCARAQIDNHSGFLNVLKLGLQRRDLDVRFFDETFDYVQVSVGILFKCCNDFAEVKMDMIEWRT